MLLEMAIGDAYGAAFEFVLPAAQKEAGLVNDGRTFQINPQTGLGEGRYTDDTQMALAIAECMTHDGLGTTAKVFDTFLHAYKRDPRKGYGTQTGKLLSESTTGEDLQVRWLAVNENSRCGGAMRAGPIGLYSDIATVMKQADFQASLTHNTEEAREGAKAVALMTHYFAYDLGPKARLGAFLEDVTDTFAWNSPWSAWVPYYTHPVVSAAITAVMDSRSMTEVFKKSVSFFGDVDTVAAIASFAASLSPEIENDIDINLYDQLENGPFGSDYLKAMDERLVTFAREQGAKVFTRSLVS